MMNAIKKIIILFILVFPMRVFADGLSVYSDNVLVYNLNDSEVLYEKNPNDKTSIASLTKIMSVIVALENIKNYDEEIVFPKVDSLTGYSKVGFIEGEKLTYNDLLYSAILPSGADATEALAILISGNTPDFVLKMNEKAKKLNMNDTSFSNTYGKDSKDNYSTMNDLLKLMKYALSNKKFYEIFTTRYYILSNGKKISSSINYYNSKTDYDVKHILGAKTGYTNNAGYCMISLCEGKEIKYLIITTNASYNTGKPLQLLDSLNISDFFDNNYKYFNILEKNEYITDIKVLGLKENIYSEEKVRLFIDKNSEISRKYTQVKKINMKSSINDVIGKYEVKYNDDIFIKDVKIPNTFKMRFCLFMYKYLYIVFKIVKLSIFRVNIV